ncbi:MAG: hypothetical protein HQ521_01430 [Bacteroidetes bacterium]|nr:hypothetical protein [Bacteroidota bacterium]
MEKRILLTFLGLITITVVISMTSCKSIKNKRTNDLAAESSIENFDEFYNRFHADSLFQMSRIKFPLKGNKVDFEGEKKWSGKNWITMKTRIYDVDTSEFQTDYKKTDISFIQKFWIEDSGYFSEYRFNLIHKKWYLIYANEQNL